MSSFSLRCPDCFSPEVVPSDEGFACSKCARRLPLENGILRALPKDLSKKAGANLGYYDSHSALKKNELARRAIRRNHEIKLRKVLELLRIEKGASPLEVVEFGMGYGSHGNAFQSLGHHYTGLDVSLGNLEQALKRYPLLSGARLVEGDAMRTPFPDASFDAAFCVAALHHLPNPSGGIQEMIRVIRPGGRFCVLEPRRYYPTQFWQWLTHPQTEVSAMKMSKEAVRGWIKSCGATKIQVSQCVFTPNGPKFLIPFFNGLDSILQAFPITHPLSVMFCVYGEK